MDDASDDGDNFCPLCMEEMDLTDRQLKPCPCGYEICVWCWHHIMEMAEDNVEGRCPACRTPYDKERIVAATVCCDRSSDFSNEKKQKSNKARVKAAEGRKNLGNVRVIQRNLVYVVGIPANLADEEIMEQRDFFGQYGKILKISVSKPSAHNSQHSMGGPTASVYVTYMKEEDALRCIQAVDGYNLGGRALKACFGTTKYCNAWLKNMQCNNPDCLYLHDEGTREDSFTKEEMLAKFGSKNQNFRNLTHPAQRRGGVGLPPPLAEVPTASSVSHSTTMTGTLMKPLLANGSLGKQSGLPAAASWGYRGISSARSTARPGLAKVRPGSVQSHQAFPTSSSHVTSGAVPLYNMSASATAAAATSSRLSSEPSQPFPRGHNIYVELANDESPTVVSTKFITAKNMNYDAQNMKISASEVTDDDCVSAYSYGSAPANISKGLPTESRTITSTAVLRTQTGIGKRNNRSATVLGGLGVRQRSDGIAASHCSQQDFGQGFAFCDGKANDVTSVKAKSSNIVNSQSNELASLRQLQSVADDSSCISTFSVDGVTDARPGFHDSTVLNSLNLFESFGESYHATSMLSEDDRSASESTMVDSFKAFSLADSGELGICGELLAPVTSCSCSSSLSGTSVDSSPIIHGYLSDEVDKDLLNIPMDSLESSSSLNVGGLSICLSTVASNHQPVSEGSGETGKQLDEFLRDPWSQESLHDSSPRSSGNNREPCMMPLADGIEQNCSIEMKVGSSLGDQNFGMESEGRISEECEQKPLERTGESQMISDMLSMGYDIWADGSPQDLANLLFERKCMESVPAPKDSLNWKSNSSKQSRFHFARKEDLAEEYFLFPKRCSSQNDCSMPLPGSNCVHTKQIPVESCAMVQKSSSGNNTGEAVPDGSHYDRCKGRPFSSSNSALGNDSSGISTSICSKSSFSTPPGFAPPARASLAASLALHPPVASQFSETPRSVSPTSIYSPFQAVSRTSDIEFIDPAIMAVGRGKVPANLGHNPSMDQGSSLYDFFSQDSSNSFSLIPSLGFTSPVKQHLKPVDTDSSSLAQQGKLFGDVGSCSQRPSLGISNWDVNAHLSSLFPYLSEHVSPASLVGQYPGNLNCSLSIQQSACVKPESRFPQYVGHLQESWSGLGPTMDSNDVRQRLAADVVGQTSDIQYSNEGAFQNHFEDMLSNKKIASKSFWEGVGLSGQTDQRYLYNQRMARYFPPL